MKKYTKYLGITIDEETLAQFDDFCHKHRVSRSLATRIALHMYMRDMENVKPFVSSEEI